jgi:chromosome segregation ATPase
MKHEEEMQLLREENRSLREQLAQRDARIQPLESLLQQQAAVMQQMQEQIVSLTQQVKLLQERQAKTATIAACPPLLTVSRARQKVCARKAQRNRVGKRDIGERACTGRRPR